MAKANRLALSMLLVLSLAAFAAAQSYTVTDLGPGYSLAINNLGDVVVQPYPSGNPFVWAPDGSILTLLPLAGDSSAIAFGINSQGLVVGSSESQTSSSAVLWTNGVPLDLGTPGTSSDATGINASGEVAGLIVTHSRGEAFLWTEATGMQGLGFLRGRRNGSDAQAINRFGQVVGSSDDYAFIWSKTTGMKSLGKLPGCVGSSAQAINDLGQVAGFSDCGTGYLHAVLWSKTKGSMLDLGVLPGASSSTAAGINNVGQVVGQVAYSLTDYRAFVWSPSTGMLDLNTLIPANSGWFLEYGLAINDKGQIVGYGLLNGQPEAFVLTPQ